MPHDQTPEVLTNAPREAFILALSVLSIVNITLALPWSPLSAQQREVIQIIDGTLTILFLADFGVRLHQAARKRTYFFHERGWLDPLGSLHDLRVLRLFRAARAWSLMHADGLRKTADSLLRDRARSALDLMTLLVILVLEIAGVGVLYFEPGAPNAHITTGGDAVWWGIVTLTTVGYGDRYPLTTGGRVVGVFLLVGDVVRFATVSGSRATRPPGAATPFADRSRAHGPSPARGRRPAAGRLRARAAPVGPAPRTKTP